MSKKPAAPKKAKKPTDASAEPEKKKITLDGLPTTDAAVEEPKKKKIIKKIKNGKDEKQDKPKKTTKTSSSEKTITKATSSKDNEDAEEEKEPVMKKKPAAAGTTTTAEPKKKTIPGFQKKECSEEKRAQLAERLKSVNEQIKSFKVLGYLTASNGTLYYPEKVVLEPTGIDVELTIKDTTFLVNTGDNRDGNPTLKSLHGKWIFTEKSWSLPITALPQVRKYFNVVEETKLTREELDELKEKIQKAREDKIQPGEVTVTDEGEFLLLTSPTGATRSIINELKSECHGTWNPSQKAWVVNSSYKDKLDAVLQEAKEEGKITNIITNSGVLANLEDD